MCMRVFVGSDGAVPLVVDDADLSLFQTYGPLAGDAPVLKHFSKPFVYEMSSIGGCACGFQYSPYDLEILFQDAVSEEFKQSAIAGHESSRESVRRLKVYIELASRTGTAEIYSCWACDEEADTETRLVVGLDHFGGDSFNFEEKQLLTVTGR